MEKLEIPVAKKINKVVPCPIKYQWFAFYENGKIYSMMSTTDHDYTAKDLKKIFDALSEDKVPNYELKGQFLTIDNKEIKNYQELWGVNLFAIDLYDYIKKGDLIMTLDYGHGNVIYYRLLRRIE